MKPKELVTEWVRRFNLADVDGMMDLYHEKAVNHQIVTDPLIGKDAIRSMFETEFGRAKMICEIENIFEDGEWAILEWRDPLGLRGCGFFHVVNDKILAQRGYFDQLNFFKIQNLSIPDSYLDK